MCKNRAFAVSGSCNNKVHWISALFNRRGFGIRGTYLRVVAFLWGDIRECSYI
ncbi:hypothetical protein C2E23DRAFT_841454 [Lenzites betulinus]|nr:hypothetical protein C2E23DRAFT_841454 [Lenzites betulinus]